MVALDVALVVVVALLAFLVAGLLRSNAEVLRALHDMGVDLSPTSAHAHNGDRSPTVASVTIGTGRARPTPRRPDPADLMDLAGVTPGGDALSIPVTNVGRDTLIAFLTSGCQTCRGFWQTLRSSSLSVPGGARLVVVTRGSEGESPAAISELAGPNLPVVMSTDVWTHYDAPAAPYFVYVSSARAAIVGEGTASTWEEVSALAAGAIADASTRGRNDRIDDELSAAGIFPGDPRLHHDAADDSRPTTAPVGSAISPSGSRP